MTTSSGPVFPVDEVFWEYAGIDAHTTDLQSGIDSQVATAQVDIASQTASAKSDITTLAAQTKAGLEQHITALVKQAIQNEKFFVLEMVEEAMRRRGY